MKWQPGSRSSKAARRTPPEAVLRPRSAIRLLTNREHSQPQSQRIGGACVPSATFSAIGRGALRLALGRRHAHRPRRRPCRLPAQGRARRLAARAGSRGDRPRHQRPRKRRLSRLWRAGSPRRSPTGEAERGIAVCGSGIGISIAANRNPPAAARRSPSRCRPQLAREHNDANVHRARRAPDRQRHGQGLRRRLPRHRLRRRAPPAPRRPTFPGIAGQPTDGHRRRP